MSFKMPGVVRSQTRAGGGKLHCFAFMYIYYNSKNKKYFCFAFPYTYNSFKKNKKLENKKAEVISPGSISSLIRYISFCKTFRISTIYQISFLIPQNIHHTCFSNIWPSLPGVLAVVLGVIFEHF